MSYCQLRLHSNLFSKIQTFLLTLISMIYIKIIERDIDQSIKKMKMRFETKKINDLNGKNERRFYISKTDYFPRVSECSITKRIFLWETRTKTRLGIIPQN